MPAAIVAAFAAALLAALVASLLAARVVAALAALVAARATTFRPRHYLCRVRRLLLGPS